MAEGWFARNKELLFGAGGGLVGGGILNYILGTEGPFAWIINLVTIGGGAYLGHELAGDEAPATPAQSGDEQGATAGETPGDLSPDATPGQPDRAAGQGTAR